MQTELTLRLEERLVRRAKAHAKSRGISVSKLVADYFALLGQEPQPEQIDMPPTVKRLRGSLRNAGIDIEDYRRHLEKKGR